MAHSETLLQNLCYYYAENRYYLANCLKTGIATLTVTPSLHVPHLSRATPTLSVYFLSYLLALLTQDSIYLSKKQQD